MVYIRRFIIRNWLVQLERLLNPQGGSAGGDPGMLTMQMKSKGCPLAQGISSCLKGLAFLSY